MTTILVLGAGGSDGGQFIDGALAELAASTGFVPEHAAVIVGTSAGAFRAATAGPARVPPADLSAALERLAGPAPRRRLLDRSARQLRLSLGRLLARVVPRTRPAPGWRTPPGPHHTGAVVVSIDLDRRHRATHPLATLADPGAAVRASAAVPFAVGPVALGDTCHADGAIWSPTSADLAVASNPSTVVVIAPMVPASGGTPLARLHRRQLRSELAELPPTTSVVLLCPGPGRRSAVRTRSAGIAAVRALRSDRSALGKIQ